MYRQGWYAVIPEYFPSGYCNPLTLWVAWLSISCQAESNCRLSSSKSLCSARAMVSLAARNTSVALWKSCVALWASSWACGQRKGKQQVRNTVQTNISGQAPQLNWQIKKKYVSPKQSGAYCKQFLSHLLLVTDLWLEVLLFSGGWR